MRKLELTQDEILLLKKLTELHLAKLDLYYSESNNLETIEQKGRMAVTAIKKSTASTLLSKIDATINNQNQ